MQIRFPNAVAVGPVLVVLAASSIAAAEDGSMPVSAGPSPPPPAPPPVIRPVVPSPPENPEPGPAFDWGPAVQQAGLFLGIQHAFRLATEPGTREGLRGPFWRDYGRAITDVGGWSDGDPFLVNYVGHPMEGSVAAFIAIHNDPRYRTVQFGRSRLYWVGRLRATAFAAAFSEQFEIGPLSEASIGNVQSVRGSGGIVDHVVTPTMGLGWTVAEDALDRYVIRRFERWNTNPMPRLLVRGVLNPSRSFSNILRFKPPWHRDSRPGVLE